MQDKINDLTEILFSIVLLLGMIVAIMVLIAFLVVAALKLV